MLEQELEDRVAFLLRQLVDAHRIARVGIERLAPGDGVGEENRVRHRRLGLALRRGQRRASAAFLAAHHLPELVEVVQHRLSLQLFPEIGGQLVVGGALVAELGVAERFAAAVRDLDAVEDIAEGNGLAVGHVRVPALARVREADRLAVLDDVRQDHHLRDAGLLVRVRDIDLELAPACAEVPELPRGKLLARIAQHAVLGERMQGEFELLRGEGPGKIQSLDGRPEAMAAGDHFCHVLPPINPRRARCSRWRRPPRSRSARGRRASGTPAAS